MKLNVTAIFLVILLLSGCDKPLNSPHTLKEYGENVSYTSFVTSPKTLDPAQSYSNDEFALIGQIYEPPLQYHYLKRPYTLIPLTAKKMPLVQYWGKGGQLLNQEASADQVLFSTYEIEIQPGIFYQPHPAFAKDEKGFYRYHALSKNQVEAIKKWNDFAYLGTRELVAEDYVYEIKRLADPNVNSPIFGLMQQYILGFSEYRNQLRGIYQKTKENRVINLQKYPLLGAEVIDKYTYRITLKGKYPQFMYWLAMYFFSPVPWEVDYFYAQPGMKAKNLSLDWQPVGTGAYYLLENNPNSQMILKRNPNFHTEYYPSEGEPGDKKAGYLEDAGKKLPFIDSFVFTLEKETIPRWNKFLQGYYDQSGIGSDTFSQAINVSKSGSIELVPSLIKKGVYLQTSIEPNLFYFGFNMLDSTVGGYSEKAKKLRRAISIALDEEEYINIFLNGRGVSLQGPIPPGIFGYVKGEHGLNPYIYDWRNNLPQRKSLDVAKQLLQEAGYPNGIDADTGRPLVLRYDAMVGTAPDSKSLFDWLRKQFSKLGIELNIEGTTYSRFQEKIRTGNVQMFEWGWISDYPDPENFLFLFYGPNSSVKSSGVNGVNYQNPIVDSLFEKIKTMQNSPERFSLIQQAVKIIQQDNPWATGVFPKTFILSHAWVRANKPSLVINNNLKYKRISPELRVKEIITWNKPIFWPLSIFFIILLVILIPAGVGYWKKIHKSNLQ